MLAHVAVTTTPCFHCQRNKRLATGMWKKVSAFPPWKTRSTATQKRFDIATTSDWFARIGLALCHDVCSFYKPSHGQTFPQSPPNSTFKSQEMYSSWAPGVWTPLTRSRHWPHRPVDCQQLNRVTDYADRQSGRFFGLHFLWQTLDHRLQHCWKYLRKGQKWSRTAAAMQTLLDERQSFAQHSQGPLITNVHIDVRIASQHIEKKTHVISL